MATFQDAPATLIAWKTKAPHGVVQAPLTAHVRRMVMLHQHASKGNHRAHAAEVHGCLAMKGEMVATSERRGSSWVTMLIGHYAEILPPSVATEILPLLRTATFSNLS